MKFSGIVISHPHADHFCGLKFLLESKKYHVSPTKLLVNTEFDPSKQLPCAQCEKLTINLHHDSATHNYSHIKGLLCSCFEVSYSNGVPPVLYTLNEVEISLSNKKAKSNNTDANKNCLIMHIIQPKYPEIVLTGDAPYDYFEGRNSLMSIFQIPHHGSKTWLQKQIAHNGIPSEALIKNAALLLALYYNRDLLSEDIGLFYSRASTGLSDRAKSFISYFELNKKKIEEGLVKFLSYRHTSHANDPEGCYCLKNPQVSWFRDHNNRCLFKKSTRDKIESDQKYWLGKLEILKESITWAYIYEYIQAELYILSAGSKYNLPAPQVLIGIIIACKWNNRKCRIALTNNYKLNTFIEYFPKEVHQFAATNTEIWYLNDVTKCSNSPCFTIDPYHQSGISCNYHNFPVIATNAESRTIQMKGMHVLSLSDRVYYDNLHICTKNSTKLRNTCTSMQYNTASKHSEETSDSMHHPTKLPKTSYGIQDTSSSSQQPAEFQKLMLSSITNNITSKHSTKFEKSHHNAPHATSPKHFTTLSKTNDSTHSSSKQPHMQIASKLMYSASNMSQLQQKSLKQYSPEVSKSSRASCRNIGYQKMSFMPCSESNVVHVGSSVYLEAYLQSIGNDTTSDNGYYIETVLEILLGSLAVSQMKLKIQNVKDEDTDSLLYFSVLAHLLRCKVKGQSKFELNYTKTAAVSATVKVYMPEPIIINKKTIVEAYFQIANAKTHKLKVHLHLKFKSNEDFDQYNISECFNPCGSCGDTLAEYVSRFDSRITRSAEAWVPVAHLTLGETLHVILGQEKAISVLQKLPACLVMKISQCRVRHHLTTVRFNDNDLEEGHIHLKLPDESLKISLTTQIELSITLLVLHIYPLYNEFEQAIQLKGKGYVLNQPVELSMCQSCSTPYDIEIMFINKLTPEGVFKLLNMPTNILQLIDQRKFKLGLNYYYNIKMTASQLYSCNKSVQISGIYFNIIDYEDVCCLPYIPPQLASFNINNCQAFIAICDPLSAVPLYGINLSFALDMPNILLDCTLHTYTDNSTCDLTFKPFFKPFFEHQQRAHDISVFESLDGICTSFGYKKSEDAFKMPIMKQVLHTIVLKRIRLISSKNAIISVEVDVSIPLIEIYSKPHLVLQDVCTKIVLTDDGFDIQFKGILSLELPVGGKIHKYSYSSLFVLPTMSSSGILSVSSGNVNDDLTLEAIMRAFDCISEVNVPGGILSSALSLAMRKLEIEFSPLSSAQVLQINKVGIVVHLDKFDIGIINFTDIDLMVELKRHESLKYEIFFQIEAYICDYLYLKLNYNPESRLLTGVGAMCHNCTAAASDALQLFKIDKSLPTYDSFSNLKMILQEHFMDIFQSAIAHNTKVNVGLVNFLEISIYIPSKKNEKYYVEHIHLQVKDIVTVRNCILDTIQFQYSQTPVMFNEASSTARVMGTIRTLTNTQSMKIVFDVTQTNEKPMVLTAEVMPTNDCAALTIKSIIEFVGCGTPTLPDVELPPILDIGLIYGKLSLIPSPLAVCSFDVAIIIPVWSIFADPSLKVYNMRVRAVWETELPQLIFDGCSLVFNGWELHLCGKVTPTMVLIKCSNSEYMLSSKNKLRYESLLHEYTPSTQPCPDIPSSINIPPLEVNNIELQIQLEKNIKKFSLNALIPPSVSWKFGFGDHEAIIDNVGGALEWTVTEKEQSYRAFVFGSLHLKSLHVDASMTLGKDVDSVVVATVSNVHLGHMADTLTSPDGQSVYASLVPENIDDTCITPFKATIALNITKKQLFMSGPIAEWSNCTLLVGYLYDQLQMDYVIMLSLNEGFKFSLLSESLASIDEYVSVRCVNLIVSSVTLTQLNTSVMTPFKQASIKGIPEIENPFSVIPNLNNNQLSNEGVKRGTTLYAVLNVHACKNSKGTIGKLYELGDGRLEQTDIIVKAFIGSSSALSVIKFSAYIKTIWLFGMLEFSNVSLEYEVKKKQDAHNQFLFMLHGKVLFHLDIDSTPPQHISFDGSLCITNYDLHFEALVSQAHKSIVQPAGINITLQKLALELQCTFGKKTPEIKIYGSLMIDAIQLIGSIYLIGTSFKVFEIELKNNLSLTALFSCSRIEWLAGSLDFTISDGQFYYAKENTRLLKQNKHYEAGYHLECTITLFYWDFIVEAHIHNRSQLRLSGRSKRKIDLGFAKLTGTGRHSENGPELIYSNKTITLLIGVELFRHPCFEGEVSYLINDGVFEGSIRYPGKILWIENPSLKVRWSQRDGFQIVEFNIPLLNSLFNIFGAIAKYAYVLYQLICGSIGLSWGIDLNLTTAPNPDPNRYLAKLVLKGAITISICGLISCKVIPLPDIPLRIVRDKDFSLSRLPQYILTCLWESAGDICKSLLQYLNPWELAKKMGKMIINGVVSAIKSVGKAVVTVAKKAWKGIKSVFGFSAFLVDSESHCVLGYVYAGKNGRKFCNIEYTVNNFGPFLIAHAIKETASDVHTTAKACMHAGEEENWQDQIKLLNELKEKTHELDLQLGLAADDVLAIKKIEMDIENGNILIAWDIGNEEGEYYTEDTGDVDYHAKVIMVTVNSTNCINIVEIFNDTLTIEYEAIKTEALSSSEVNENIAYTEGGNDKQAIEDEVQDKLESEQENGGSDEVKHAESQLNENSSEAPVNTIKGPHLSKKFSLNSVSSHMEQAVYICASIEPTVTLKMMTLPPDQPIIMDSHMTEMKDNIWMTEKKEEIKSRGRNQEVTLHGGKKSVRHILKPVSVADTTATAECLFSEEQNFVINGTISPIVAPNKCLVQISDESDSTIIVKHGIFSSNEHDIVEFSIKFSEYELPNDSPGPYVVSYLILANDFASSALIAISEFQLKRCPTAFDVHIAVPSSTVIDKEIVTLLWKSKENVTDYLFKIMLCGTASKTAYEMNGEDLESDLLFKKEQALFTCTTSINTPDTASEDVQAYSYSFDPSSLYSENGIAPSTGVTINCTVVTFSTSNQILPSLQVSTELIVVAAPSCAKLHRHKKTPGLLFSWPYTVHAVSYEIEFVEKSTNTVKHRKMHHCGKDDISVLDGCSMDKLVSVDDLKHICHMHSQLPLHLQIYALGFGEKVHKSIVPTVAEDKIVVIPLQLMYNPSQDIIEVRFTPLSSLYPYTVTLYEYDSTINDKEVEDDKYLFLCNYIIHLSSKCNVPHVIKIDLKPCRHYLTNGSYVTAYACMHDTSTGQIFHAGVSVKDLECLPVPQYFSVHEEYQLSWNVSTIVANWVCDAALIKPQYYQFGLQSVESNSVIWHLETTKNNVLIDFSQLSLPAVSSLKFQCFVKAISQDNTSAITGSPVLNGMLYQCVTTPTGSKIFYTGVTLQKLWQRHLLNSISCCTICVPTKATWMLFKNQKPFPWYLFCSRIRSKFWTDQKILAKGK